MLILYGINKQLTLGTAICCILLVLYGFRLGGYLAYREFKMTSYNKNMVGEIKQTVPMGVKIMIWLTCALLYVLQIVPILYRLQNGGFSDIWTYIGIVIMICGIVL